MASDLETLLAPVSEDAPSGPDLTYDAEFLALEQAAQGKAEQQFGDTVIPAEEPDWRDVRQRCEALLGRSKDLRVAVLLARALMRTEGMPGLARGLAALRELLERYWETVHPQLDREDNDDPTMRMNALAPLSDPETVLREVRTTEIVGSAQHGRVSIRDILIAANKLPAAGEAALSSAQIEGILRAAATEQSDSLEGVVAAAHSVTALETLLSEKGVITQAPDLRPLNDMLHTAATLCTAARGADGAEKGESAAESSAGEGAAAAAIGVPGQIRTREDAIQMLDRVCRFIEQSEPSNPAPLFIRRAQRLMSASFVEIIQDLAPESLAEIQKLAGLEKAPAE